MSFQLFLSNSQLKDPLEVLLWSLRDISFLEFPKNIPKIKIKGEVIFPLLKNIYHPTFLPILSGKLLGLLRFDFDVDHDHHLQEYLYDETVLFYIHHQHHHHHLRNQLDVCSKIPKVLMLSNMIINIFVNVFNELYFHQSSSSSPPPPPLPLENFEPRKTMFSSINNLIEALQVNKLIFLEILCSAFANTITNVNSNIPDPGIKEFILSISKTDPENIGSDLIYSYFNLSDHDDNNYGPSNNIFSDVSIYTNFIHDFLIVMNTYGIQPTEILSFLSSAKNAIDPMPCDTMIRIYDITLLNCLDAGSFVLNCLHAIETHLVSLFQEAPIKFLFLLRPILISDLTTSVQSFSSLQHLLSILHRNIDVLSKKNSTEGAM